AGNGAAGRMDIEQDFGDAGAARNCLELGLNGVQGTAPANHFDGGKVLAENAVDRDDGERAGGELEFSVLIAIRIVARLVVPVIGEGAEFATKLAFERGHDGVVPFFGDEPGLAQDFGDKVRDVHSSPMGAVASELAALAWPMDSAELVKVV